MREPDMIAELPGGSMLRAWKFDQEHPPTDAEIEEINPDGVEHWPGEGWFLTKWTS